MFKLGRKLCLERIKRPSSFVLSKCLFPDDATLAGVLLYRRYMMLAVRIFYEVATENGFIQSVPKTKLLVAGIGLTNDDLASLELDGDLVEVVEQFKYLGSLVEACGGIVCEVSCRIIVAQVSRDFGSLASTWFCVYCIRFDNEDQVDNVPLCSVGSVTVCVLKSGPTQ